MKTTHSPLAVTGSRPSALNQDEIARRAHALWLARGSPDGSPMDDWLEAERQLAREHDVQPPARQPAAADEIDEDKLSHRLDDFGEPAPRSSTSVD